jgi:hypothetical protein
LEHKGEALEWMDARNRKGKRICCMSYWKGAIAGGIAPDRRYITAIPIGYDTRSIHRGNQEGGISF